MVFLFILSRPVASVIILAYFWNSSEERPFLYAVPR